MFYDLNIPRADSKSDSVLRDTVERAVKYGYKGIAITTSVDESVFEKPKRDKSQKKGGSTGVVTVNTIPLPFDLKALKLSYPKIKFFNRIDLKVGESCNIRKFILSKEVKKYDLIAFEPENQDVLKSLTKISQIHIISYNPVNKCDLTFNRKLYNQFVNQGVYFELIYGPGIVDSTARKNLLILSHVYKAVGKSKNIIVSSGAQLPYQIRGPYDVINFNLLFGLNEEQSKNSISRCCEKIVSRARMQKYSKSPIEIVQLSTDSEEKMEIDVS